VHKKQFPAYVVDVLARFITGAVHGQGVGEVKQHNIESKLRYRKLPVVGILFISSVILACNGQQDDVDSDSTPEFKSSDSRESIRLPDLPASVDNYSVPGSEFATTEMDSGLTTDTQTLYASANIEPASGSDVSGSVQFRQEHELVSIEGRLTGLKPGMHGLHIHETGDCSDPEAASADGHFAPDGHPHGSPDSLPRNSHTGDLGNILADHEGVAVFQKTHNEMRLDTGEYTILKRAVIVHAEQDDLVSQPSGAAGKRVGCGVVTNGPDSVHPAPSLP